MDYPEADIEDFGELTGVPVLQSKFRFGPKQAYSNDLGAYIGDYFHLPNNQQSPNFLCNLGIPMGYPEPAIEYNIQLIQDDFT